VCAHIILWSRSRSTLFLVLCDFHKKKKIYSKSDFPFFAMTIIVVRALEPRLKNTKNNQTRSSRLKTRRISLAHLYIYIYLFNITYRLYCNIVYRMVYLTFDTHYLININTFENIYFTQLKSLKNNIFLKENIIYLRVSIFYRLDYSKVQIIYSAY